MLGAVLLAGIVAAPLSSAALFAPAHRRAKTTGAWPAIRRFVLALAGTAILGGAVAAALRLLGASASGTRAAVVAIVVASFVWLPGTRRWTARAHLCWASSVLLFVAYLIFILQWTFASNLGPAATAGGLVLWLLEVFAGLLAVTRRRQRSVPSAGAGGSRRARPYPRSARGCRSSACTCRPI